MIDWVQIERLVAQAIRGGGLSAHEQTLIERAWRSDRAKYMAMRAAIKKAAVDEMCMRQAKK